MNKVGNASNGPAVLTLQYHEKTATILACSWLQKAVEALAGAIVAATDADTSVAPLMKIARKIMFAANAVALATGVPKDQKSVNKMLDTARQQSKEAEDECRLFMDMTTFLFRAQRTASREQKRLCRTCKRAVALASETESYAYNQARDRSATHDISRKATRVAALLSTIYARLCVRREQCRV